MYIKYKFSEFAHFTSEIFYCKVDAKEGIGMEKLFNSPILDKIYEARCDEFERKILQKKGRNNKFHKSILIETRLTNLIKKTVVDDKSKEEILKKLDEYELAVSETINLWNKEYYKLGIVDGQKIIEEIEGV